MFIHTAERVTYLTCRASRQSPRGGGSRATRSTSRVTRARGRRTVHLAPARSPSSLLSPRASRYRDRTCFSRYRRKERARAPHRSRGIVSETFFREIRFDYARERGERIARGSASTPVNPRLTSRQCDLANRRRRCSRPLASSSAISEWDMRRPLTRHLSEGGGSGVGATTDNGLGVGSGAGRRQLRSSAKEGGDERGYTWTCRDYSHHLSFADLLKAPAPPAECRGRATVSPEARSSAIHR